MVAPAEKASLLGSQFDSKQCREQLVTPVSCFPQSRCNSFAFQTSVLLHLLLDLDTYGGVDPLGVFTPFLIKVGDIIAPKLRIFFCKGCAARQSATTVVCVSVLLAVRENVVEGYGLQTQIKLCCSRSVGGPLM